MPAKLDRAIELAKEATAADTAGKYEQAITLYSNCAEHFMHAIKYEIADSQSKSKIRHKTEEYINRAEKLKEAVKNKSNRRVQASVSGSGKRQSSEENDKDDSGANDEDKETKKLMSQIRDVILIEKPNVKWNDVAGLENAKESLQEAAILPIQYPELFLGKRKPWKGILLYGPPGTGKTFLAKAVATEANQSNFFRVSPSNLVSKWLGESEKLIRCLFELARKKAPSIIFIDEIDSLCRARTDGESESTNRIKTEFLVQMQTDEVKENTVLVLGATNIPWSLDTAIRRRFQRRIYIPLPDEIARKELFRLELHGEPHALSDADFELLAEKTENYSGSDISVLVRDAIYEPVRKFRSATHFKKVTGPSPIDKKKIVHDLLTPCSPGDLGAIEMAHQQVPREKLLVPLVTPSDMLKALAKSKPNCKKEDLKRFEEFTRELGEDG